MRMYFSWLATVLISLLFLIVAIATVTELGARKSCVVTLTIFFLAVGLLAIASSAVMPVAIERALL